MQTTTIKLWCNSFKNPMYKALVSTLLLDSRNYIKVDEPEVAALWCLIDEGGDLYAMSHLYQTLSDKPKVIYLARAFQPPPISEWVFFKSPIHATALFNWLESQKFSDLQISDNSQYHSRADESADLQHEKASDDYGEDTLTAQRWYREPFKLRYWPNVTQYSDSPDIIAICTKMLRDWMTYDTLIQSNLSADIIKQMLSDAEDEQNLYYKYANSAEFLAIHTHELNEHRPIIDDKDRTSIATGQNPTALKEEDSNSHSNTPSSKETQDKGWGFFKSLLNRFVN